MLDADLLTSYSEEASTVITIVNSSLPRDLGEIHSNVFSYSSNTMYVSQLSAHTGLDMIKLSNPH